MEILKIASEILRIAEDLVFAGDYEYIYDPDHRKHPGGGYIKTESGWSKGKKEKKKRENGTPSEKINLKELSLDSQSFSNHWNVRRDVAMNKNTHPDTLARLSNDKEWIVRRTVAENKNTKPEVLTKLSFDESYDVREAVAKNTNTPTKTIDRMVNEVFTFYKNIKIDDEVDTNKEDEITNIARIAAENPKISEKMARKCVTNGSGLEMEISKNPGCSAGVLDELSHHHESYIRESVAKNLNTSSETLNNLLKDENDDVKKAAHNGIIKKRALSFASKVYPEIDFSKMPPEFRDKLRNCDPDDIRNIILGYTYWAQDHK